VLSVGIDPALNHTGIAILRNGEVLKEKHKPQTWRTNERGIDRLMWLRWKLVRLIEEEIKELRRKNEIVWYGVEDYAWNLGKSAHQMGEWGGQIRVTFYERDIKLNAIREPQRLWIINQSEVKKFATGKGISKKEKLLMDVGRKWGKSFDNSDEAEAFLMALMLYWVYALATGKRKPEELAKYQLEVLEKHLARTGLRQKLVSRTARD
jgi:Holliday junction resolvasome RuvABC endonuclease subunit